MTRPRLLDLYCCEGGASTGYARAGFDVVGVDIAPQPLYPFTFVQADALEYLAEHWQEFDAVHASPPCQAYSTATPAHRRAEHPDLLQPTLDALAALPLPWIVENVEGARRRMPGAVRLCGSAFGMRIRRHRYFQSSALLWPLACRHAEQGEPVGVYGQHPDQRAHARPGSGSSRGVKARTLDEARDVMGMPWASWSGCAEAIPPAYAEWLGGQLLASL
jgi:DNA (cytosine-5)-methyltransferase 1